MHLQCVVLVCLLVLPTTVIAVPVMPALNLTKEGCVGMALSPEFPAASPLCLKELGYYFPEGSMAPENTQCNDLTKCKDLKPSGMKWTKGFTNFSVADSSLFLSLRGKTELIVSGERFIAEQDYFAAQTLVATTTDVIDQLSLVRIFPYLVPPVTKGDIVKWHLLKDTAEPIPTTSFESAYAPPGYQYTMTLADGQTKIVKEIYPTLEQKMTNLLRFIGDPSAPPPGNGFKVTSIQPVVANPYKPCTVTISMVYDENTFPKAELLDHALFLGILPSQWECVEPGQEELFLKLVSIWRSKFKADYSAVFTDKSKSVNLQLKSGKPAQVNAANRFFFEFSDDSKDTITSFQIV